MSFVDPGADARFIRRELASRPLTKERPHDAFNTYFAGFRERAASDDVIENPPDPANVYFKGRELNETPDFDPFEKANAQIANLRRSMDIHKQNQNNDSTNQREKAMARHMFKIRTPSYDEAKGTYQAPVADLG